MKTYKAIEPILHNGKSYEPESTIELTDADAKQLLEIGAIVDGAAAEKTPAPEGEARIAAIKDAIAKIAAGDEAAWAKDGKPKTEAIAAITGWPVNATERNEIWEAVKPAQVAAAVNDMSANAGTATA